MPCISMCSVRRGSGARIIVTPITERDALVTDIICDCERDMRCDAGSGRSTDPGRRSRRSTVASSDRAAVVKAVIRVDGMRHTSAPVIASRSMPGWPAIF